MAEKKDISQTSTFSQLLSYIKHLVSKVRELTKQLAEKSEKLEEAQAEIRRLKNLPKKPKLKPSKLDEPLESNTEKPEKPSKKRAGSSKRSKKSTLKIHQTEQVKAIDVPQDWHLIGYKSRVIEDFIIRANNTDYQLEIWQSPDGSQQITASLPSYLQNTRFGPTLNGYILHQYYECGVSQPLILTTLRDYGVDISSGQISNILIENKAQFHQEKNSLLAKAIELEEELRTDDTGARHRFKNGYCNCINSDLFTYFTTTYSKSRINFLEILRLEKTNYELNEIALEYAQREALPQKYYSTLLKSYEKGACSFKDKTSLEAYFKAHNITAKYAIKTITQALLIGALVANGFNPNISVHSDGAGQFNVFIHSLCWKHAERPLIQLICATNWEQSQLEAKKKAFWLLYQQLKSYKDKPSQQVANQLSQQFDQLCEPIVGFEELNHLLKALKAKKDKLLLVLIRPRTSLHNNDSERDIREYVKRRKISAGTRSENGKKARDTFLSLKKTCRKLGISFWEYLLDRLQHNQLIPPLSLIMEQKSRTANI